MLGWNRFSYLDFGLFLSLVGVGPCGFPSMMFVSVSSVELFTPWVSNPVISTPGGSKFYLLGLSCIYVVLLRPETSS